jgi:hypothetical protein
MKFVTKKLIIFHYMKKSRIVTNDRCFHSPNMVSPRTGEKVRSEKLAHWPILKEEWANFRDFVEASEK